MIPNIHQSIDEIIKISSAEQKIIWQQIRLITGEVAAVRQTHLQGAIIPTINTFVPGQLWFAYKLHITGSNGFVGQPYINLFDENNIAFSTVIGGAPYWDVTAAALRYNPASIVLNNIYFSRIDPNNFQTFIFTGYKIN